MQTHQKCRPRASHLYLAVVGCVNTGRRARLFVLPMTAAGSLINSALPSAADAGPVDTDRASSAAAEGADGVSQLAEVPAPAVTPEPTAAGGTRPSPGHRSPTAGTRPAGYTWLKRRRHRRIPPWEHHGTSSEQELTC